MVNSGLILVVPRWISSGILRESLNLTLLSTDALKPDLLVKAA